MEKLSNRRIFEIISRDKKFFKFYLKNYLNRLLPNQYNERFLNIFLEYLNHKNIKAITILKLAGFINNESDEKVLRDYDLDLQSVPKGTNVYQKMSSILEIYKTLWVDLPVLEKEALLNIHLMKNRLFKANNEFICHLILIANLINNYYPPLILKDKEKYYQILKSGDALKFAEEFANRSEVELNFIIKLYKESYSFPAGVSIEEILIQKGNY